MWQIGSVVYGFLLAVLELLQETTYQPVTYKKSDESAEYFRFYGKMKSGQLFMAQVKCTTTKKGSPGSYYLSTQ